MTRKATEDELSARLDDARTKVEIGALYQHYKGSEYKVLDLAILENTEEACVIYQALYGKNFTFIRPVASWVEEVLVEGASTPRFSLIS